MPFITREQALATATGFDTPAGPEIGGDWAWDAEPAFQDEGKLTGLPFGAPSCDRAKAELLKSGH